MDWTYTKSESKMLKAGCQPDERGDRWVVLFVKGNLNFYRSFTGHCTYSVATEETEGKMTLLNVKVCRDQSLYTETDDAVDLDMLRKIIDYYLLKKNLH